MGCCLLVLCGVRERGGGSFLSLPSFPALVMKETKVRMCVPGPVPCTRWFIKYKPHGGVKVRYVEIPQTVLRDDPTMGLFHMLFQCPAWIFESAQTFFFFSWPPSSYRNPVLCFPNLAPSSSLQTLSVKSSSLLYTKGFPSRVPLQPPWQRRWWLLPGTWAASQSPSLLRLENLDSSLESSQ